MEAQWCLAQKWWLTWKICLCLSATFLIDPSFHVAGSLSHFGMSQSHHPYFHVLYLSLNLEDKFWEVFFFLLHHMISFKKLNFLNKINNMGQKEYVVAHQQLPNVERMGYYTTHGVTTQLPHHLLSMNGISNFLS